MWGWCGAMKWRCVREEFLWARPRGKEAKEESSGCGLGKQPGLVSRPRSVRKRNSWVESDPSSSCARIRIVPCATHCGLVQLGLMIIADLAPHLEA